MTSTTALPPIRAARSARPDRPVPATAPFARTVAVLSVVALLATSQLYGAIPLVGAAAADWHTRPGPLTWLVTAFGLGYAAGFLLFGPLSDRFGRRRVMVAGVAATAVTTALVALAPGLGVALALRALQGLTIGAFPPVAMAYVGERVEPRRRLLTVTAMTTGFLAASVVGQLLAQAMLALLGWRSFFALGAVLFAAGALALHRVLLPDAPGRGGSPAAAYRAMPRLLGTPGLRLLYLAVPILLGSFVAIYTGLQLTGTGGLLGLRAAALPVILAIPFATARLARLDPVRRCAAALLVTAAGTALIGVLTPGTGVLALLLMAVTAGVGVAAPGMIDLVGSRAGDRRAPAISLYTALMFVGASAGPQLAAALAGRGLAAVALVLAALLALAAGLVAAARRGLRAG
ncbi:MFS transporter [Actinomadura atramentaria]|uniref:MFS transporter n=1 Tax=Actinomadura atramentaria TaxID=1990 RepID=UPI00036AF5CA|nr:MFS transporter [Actinomadura atramentaria]